jgi:hypothetical protein
VASSGLDDAGCGHSDYECETIGYLCTVRLPRGIRNVSVVGRFHFVEDLDVDAGSSLAVSGGVRETELIFGAHTGMQSSVIAVSGVCQYSDFIFSVGATLGGSHSALFEAHQAGTLDISRCSLTQHEEDIVSDFAVVRVDGGSLRLVSFVMSNLRFRLHPIVDASPSPSILLRSISFSRSCRSTSWH